MKAAWRAGMSVGLGMVMVAGLVACGGSSDTSDTADKATPDAAAAPPAVPAVVPDTPMHRMTKAELDAAVAAGKIKIAPEPPPPPKTEYGIFWTGVSFNAFPTDKICANLLSVGDRVMLNVGGAKDVTGVDGASIPRGSAVTLRVKRSDGKNATSLVLAATSVNIGGKEHEMDGEVAPTPKPGTPRNVPLVITGACLPVDNGLTVTFAKPLKLKNK